MRQGGRFAVWIGSGGDSIQVLPLRPVWVPEVKCPVVRDRLLDSIIGDALAAGVFRLTAFLPAGVGIDVRAVDLMAIREQLRASIVARVGLGGEGAEAGRGGRRREIRQKD